MNQKKAKELRRQAKLVESMELASKDEAYKAMKKVYNNFDQHGRKIEG